MTTNQPTTPISLDRRTVLKFAGATALSSAFAAGTATAQHGSTPVDPGTPFEVEGPMTSIVDNGDGTGSIVAMGMTLLVDTNSVLTSPSGYVLSLAEVSNDAPPLPGRSQPGFVGGTVKGAGVIGGTIEHPELRITDTILEPAENVIFGIVTANDPQLVVNGDTIVPITDSRMAFPGYTDAAGASLTTTQIPPGTLAAAEGYYSSTDGALYVFSVELDFVADSGETGTESISIARAEYRPDKGELRVDGAASNPDYTVGIANVVETDSDVVYETIDGINPVSVDAVDNSWRVDVERNGLSVEPEIVAQLLAGETVVAQSGHFAPTIDD